MLTKTLQSFRYQHLSKNAFSWSQIGQGQSFKRIKLDYVIILVTILHT